MTVTKKSQKPKAATLKHSSKFMACPENGVNNESAVVGSKSLYDEVIELSEAIASGSELVLDGLTDSEVIVETLTVSSVPTIPMYTVPDHHDHPAGYAVLKSRSVGKIIQPVHHEDNYCFPFAVFNVVGPEAKAVFEPAKFAKYMLDAHGKGNKDGYHFNDMSSFLRHLLSTNQIKSYVWKALSKNNLGQIFFKPSMKEGDVLIIFGKSSTSVKAAQVLRAVRKVAPLGKPVWERTSEVDRHIQLGILAAKSRQLVSRACPGHAVAVRFELHCGILLPVLYDSAKKTAKVLNAEVYAASLIETNLLYYFKVEV